MSQINNQIVTRFAAHQGNAIAVMNQIAGGMTNIGRASMQAQRATGLFDQQMRAFGTTLRYAFAGSVIFGATRMITTLRETQKQLGLIGVLAGNDLEAGTQGMRNFYTAAQRGAINSLTPVSDFNDALINLFSTIKASPDMAVKMVEELSKGATLAQVPVQDLTKAVTGMNQAFGAPQNLANIQKGTRGFFSLVSEAPGGIAAGPQIIQQLPQLSATSRLANINESQMLGLYLTTLRAGGTPATAGRGLQYFLQSVAVPQSKEAATAMKQAGITPETVQQRGGMWAISRLLGHAQSLGATGTTTAAGKLKGMTDEDLSMLEGLDPAAVGGTLGISGKGFEFLHKSIGRIHGIREAILLMAQKGDIGKDIGIITEAQSNEKAALDAYRKAWEEFERNNPLQAAAISIDTMRRQMTTALEPAINAFAGKISDLGQWFNDQAMAHPERTRHRTQIGMGVGGAALFLNAIGAFGGAGRFMGRIGGAAGQAFVTKTAMQAATTGAALGPGMSPQNPLYVIVVGEIFGKAVTGDPTVPPVAPVPGGKTSWWKRAVPALGMRAALPFAAAWAATDALPDIGQGDLKIDPSLKGFKKDWKTISGAGGSAWDFMQGMNPANLGTQRITGQASVAVDVNINQAGTKVTRKRVHVPVELFNVGGNTPSSRGGRPRRSGR